MDGGKGSFTLRFSGGASDKTIINPIMLRFRPIAPKPADDGSASGGLRPENRNGLAPKGRTKRKYVRVNRSKRYMKNKVEERKDGVDGTVVTLQLLPEMTAGKDTATMGSSQNLDLSVIKSVQQLPSRMNFNRSGNNYMLAFCEADRTAVMPSTGVVESWVMMECVTDMCVDGGALGNTDVEKMANLKVDACPGLVSDGVNSVQWVNIAYQSMVVGHREDGEAPPEVFVRLILKEKLPVQSPAFACRVRVVHTWRKEKRSQTMPCDVWKMDSGGFAWRLDVKAALSLGR